MFLVFVGRLFHAFVPCMENMSLNDDSLPEDGIRGIATTLQYRVNSTLSGSKFRSCKCEPEKVCRDSFFGVLN